MFSVMSVSHSVILSTGEGGFHVTITHDELDLTVQGFLGTSPPWQSYLVAKTGDLLKLVHLKTLILPPVLTSGAY